MRQHLLENVAGLQERTWEAVEDTALSLVLLSRRCRRNWAGRSWRGRYGGQQQGGGEGHWVK